MTETSLDVLRHAGETRGADGHVPDASDFDEHVRFYKGALRVAGIFIAHVAVILLALYFFIAR